MGETTAIVNQSGAMITHYVPPLLGVGMGYLVGDIFNVGAWINGAVHAGGKVADAAAEQLSKLIVSGIFGLVAVLVWKAFSGIIGGVLAGFFAGVALRSLLSAL